MLLTCFLTLFPFPPSRLANDGTRQQSKTIHNQRREKEEKILSTKFFLLRRLLFKAKLNQGQYAFIIITKK